MDTKRLGGHLAAATAYAIFGFNIVFCKDIAKAEVISPMALYTLRALVAAVLFWLISIFTPRERVPWRDILKIGAASIIGLFIPQVTFLQAITVSTTIDTSILGSLTPIWTMFFAFFCLGEPLTFKKITGVALSFLGALLLIFNSVHASNGVESTSTAGIILLLINTISFALYLGMFRPLISRYSVITFMKWAFLWSLAISLPLSWHGLVSADYAHITPQVGGEIAFLILAATCVAYFLIPLGQKHLRPTVVSMYTYLQPIIACICSMCMGMDTLTWQKMLAFVLVLGGVAIVNQSRAKS